MKDTDKDNGTKAQLPPDTGQRQDALPKEKTEQPDNRDDALPQWPSIH